ncbi:unnamed protein product [Arabis nemorensis]|uniref:Uncharacterized protein n=1 Tax=Arabis nemorensis TaxID=586526 RepID=A0A565BTZ3_9BRAS|nr:unnamed protein product [Arabis nemorensis]
MGIEGASPAMAPTSGSAESPGGFASGPSVGRASDAPSTVAPYSLFLNLIIFPIAFSLHIYH